MSKDEFQVGDMVVLSSGQWRGISAVISQPLDEARRGHALIHVDGHIIGVSVSADEVQLADENAQGFAQLAYNLIKLGSHVIEQTLI
jgi:hypothetical protein